MRTFDTPYVADWYAVSLRWLTLLGMVASLAMGDVLLSEAPIWPLIGLVIWNLAMSVFAGLNLRFSYHRQISLAVDFLMVGAFFWLQGGVSGPVYWAGLLPILMGAIYFELLGALVVAWLFFALELASLWTGFISLVFLQKSLGVLAVTVGSGLLFGYISRKLIEQLRKIRVTRLDEEQRRIRMENERWHALYELTATLTSTLSYKRVLDSALDLGYVALNPDPDAEKDERLISAMMLFNGDQLEIRSARRFTSADLNVKLNGSEGILKRVLDEGEAVLTDNISFDPELGRVIALRNCTAAYCFPLRSGFNVYGAMLFAHADPNYFMRERTDLLDMIGRQVVIAIQNARLYQDLIEEKERMMDVHEEARKKLARDLHDGPTQSVAAMAMRINLTRRMFDKDTKSALNELVKIEDLAHRTTKEIRHMLFTLRPLILESQGLTAALESMAEKIRETYRQNVVIDVNEKIVADMEMGKQGVVFYIVEEAVNNARKHAAASNIWVRLKELEPGLALLEIQDDGIGFDVQSMNKAYDKRGSLGMINLRERTEMVNGLLNIQSQHSRGTLVQVYVPLTEEAADRLHHAKR
ncbi:MAG: GAF domain-containing protein [Anaerolineales bacterium]|nr:GAF domain-containing protein [Anaerolineales bacterium]